MSEEKQPLIDEGAPDVLNRQQINQCMMDIEDLHPLRDRAKFDNILPALSFLRKCRKRKPDFKHALRKTLLEEMNIKMPKSESQIIDDPFLILGYGVNAYFDIMLSLVYLCLTITLFCVPMYYYYTSNDQQALKTTTTLMGLAKTTLGNFGGATVICQSKRLQAQSLTINCDTGRIDSSDALFGLMSSQISEKTYCTETAIWKKEDKSSITNCTA